MAIGLIPGKFKYLRTYFHPELGKVRILDYYPEGTHPTNKDAKGNYYKVQQVDPPQSYSYVAEDTLADEEVDNTCVVKVWNEEKGNYTTLLVEDKKVKVFSKPEEANDYLTEKGIGGVVIRMKTLDGQKAAMEIAEIEKELNSESES